MILFCTAPTHRPTHQWSFRKTGTMGTLAEICAGSKHREHFCGGPGVSPRVSPRKNFGIVHAKFCINLVHFWPRKMVRNAVHNPFHKHFNSENVVPMRSGSFSTTGTAFSSVAPRNGMDPATQCALGGSCWLMHYTNSHWRWHIRFVEASYLEL